MDDQYMFVWEPSEAEWFADSCFIYEKEDFIVVAAHGDVHGRLYFDDREVDPAAIRDIVMHWKPIRLICCYPKRVNDIWCERLQEEGIELVGYWDAPTMTYGSILLVVEPVQKEVMP